MDIWMFLAGLGFFLFGMSRLEMQFKNTSSRSLKLFLKRNTKNLAKAILGGAVVTAIVQSSSVVSLIVLAFVESGILSFRNALGVIFGANLGTTISSWIVASIGFKFDTMNYTMPFIAVSAISMFFFESRRKIFNLSSLFFYFGILFLGLGFMKDGAMRLVEGFEIETLSGYGSVIYVLTGFILTTIIQSSSATMAITLTGIYSGVLTLPSAAAVAIGSEVGTTIKVLFWGFAGSANKKRVALGNLLFNIVTAILAFIFLDWIIIFIGQIVGISDPLYALVFFQTSINFFSVLLFIPFIRLFSNWLGRQFADDHLRKNLMVSDIHPGIPTLAIDNMRVAVLNLLENSISFIRNVINAGHNQPNGFMDSIRSFTDISVSKDESYTLLKQAEGEILTYYSRIRKDHLQDDDDLTLLHLMNVARQAVYSAKTIKGIAHNFKQFNASEKDFLYHQMNLIRIEWDEFEKQLKRILKLNSVSELSMEVETAIQSSVSSEGIHQLKVVEQLQQKKINQVEASTFLNVEREITACKKSLLNALLNLDNALIDVNHHLAR
jgi:phosphate:Na+ symporter